MKLFSVQPLYIVLSRLVDIEMPMSIAYKFAKLISEIEDNYDFYVKKFRNIISKYCEKDETGNPIQDENGNIQLQKDLIDLAEKELTELNQIDIDRPSVRFTMEELQSLQITPKDAMVLIDFIQD